MRFSENDLLIDRMQRDYAWTMHKFHYHDRYEIYYLASGSRTILRDKTIYELFPGDVMLLRPNVLHKGAGPAAHEKYGAEFSRAFLSSLFTERMQELLLSCFKYDFIRLNDEERIEFERIYLNMLDRYSSDGDCFAELCMLLRLLDRAGKRCEHEQRETRRLTPSASSRSEDILTYIEENFRNIRSVDEIAAGIHIDKSYLCRLFKHENGMTVMDYLWHFRVQHACEYLATTEYSVNETARLCGFENTSHFISVFKRLIGSTPGQFRKHYRGTELYPVKVRSDGV